MDTERAEQALSPWIAKAENKPQAPWELLACELMPFFSIVMIFVVVIASVAFCFVLFLCLLGFFFLYRLRLGPKRNTASPHPPLWQLVRDVHESLAPLSGKENKFTSPGFQLSAHGCSMLVFTIYLLPCSPVSGGAESILSP